jgi:hypothetical protein
VLSAGVSPGEDEDEGDDESANGVLFGGSGSVLLDVEKRNDEGARRREVEV